MRVPFSVAMLAERLATLVNRHWLVLLVGWVVLAGGLKLVAPTWDEIAKDGDLEYLPADVASLQGERLLREAFPNEKATSQIVVALSRDGEPLTPDDRRFGLKIAEAFRQDNELPTVDVWDETTKVVGKMLLADEGLATTVVVRLTNGLMDVDNVRLLRRANAILADLGSERPEGVRIDLTGSAMIGGDLRASIEESLSNTEATTIVLVLGCLIAIYRAPILVLIPLATIALSMSVATDIVALLAQHFGPESYDWSDFKIFTTTKIFVIVILFGAGTDYCLFLIARYKEELASGVPRTEAAGRALANVGDALAGSAMTTILGLATMAFAQYGKFVSSGPIVAVCLFVALLACVSFAPSLLRGLGTLVFWPFGNRLTSTEMQAKAERPDSPLWGSVADIVMRRPVTIL
ncbi:MAG: MMPL family transporter, partial [Planctomycetota bacterium]